MEVFFESNPLGMARIEPDGRLIGVNAALCTMLGYSRDELLGRRIADVTHPDDIAAATATSHAAADHMLAQTQGAASVEKRYVRKSGAILHALVSTTPIRTEQGDPTYLLAQIIDVSEQRRHREIQEAHAHVLEMVAMHEPLSNVLGEIVARAEAVNPDVRASVLLVSPDKRTLHQGAAPSLPPAYNAKLEGLVIGPGVGSCGTAAATGKRVVVEDVNHHPYWAAHQALVQLGAFGACWSEPILDANDEVLGTFAMYYREPRAPEDTDLEYIRATARLAGIAISRRLAEDALSQSEARLRTVIENAPEALVLMDVHAGRFVDANENALLLFGLSMEELRASNLDDLSPALQPSGRQSPEALADLVELAVRGAKPTVDWVYLNRSREVSCKMRLVRLPSSEGLIVRLSIMDCTQENELQEQLRQAQKMEAIGQLAGGVAHDFNNILAGIMGYAELLKMSLNADADHPRHADHDHDDEDDVDLINQIIQASERAADLTKQLLAFSRKGRTKSIPVDLHALIAEVILLLSRTIDKRIQITTELRADEATVLGDPSQLHHALLNLGLNARDAMPNGGRIIIRTRNLSLDEVYRRARAQQITPGQHVELEVLDTGVGMSPEIQQRIFEPFFSTKAPGKGTGLGLAGVYGTVQSHGGQILVDSEPDKGTSFTMLFPTVPESAVQQPLPDSPRVRGHGHILIVDDDEMVLVFAAKFLRGLGYMVTTCSDGVAAVALFERRTQDFDLVILDLIMPKLNGLDTYRRLEQLCPNVRVLVTSGYSCDHAVETMLEQDGLAFLPKPFRLEQLATAVARACGAAPPLAMLASATDA
ncbi:diguanylate cyclase/phosphodiesterase [Enhygromyxa salina]|uniref:histidine kinase n=2 Tax=Enhygromyxa salina TaxID=215803 RepID=A0A0C1ZTB4_9BACT|nr:diguanylate cyclase/phosphodiesterase [Enhygromyxa salina]